MRNFSGAAIAQWICLRLPFCRPGFEFPKHHLHFKFLCFICRVKRTKISRPYLAHFFKNEKDKKHFFKICFGCN